MEIFWIYLELFFHSERASTPFSFYWSLKMQSLLITQKSAPFSSPNFLLKFPTPNSEQTKVNTFNSYKYSMVQSSSLMYFLNFLIFSYVWVNNWCPVLGLSLIDIWIVSKWENYVLTDFSSSINYVCCYQYHKRFS